MSERKVLNKYYPPDFDPTKLPKLKRGRNRQFVIRIMAPFSMRCTTCGEYIYKGRKFNSRMETVENENYLGLRIYRFYIRCTKCISEITFKTDPENTDYTMEHGATRNFEAVRRLGEQLDHEKKEREEEEANNPMKALENRTRDSKREMESLEKLEELKDLNQRIAGIDPERLIQEHLREEKQILEQQEQDDEMLVRQLFGKGGSAEDGYLKRILDDDSDEESKQKKSKKSKHSSNKKMVTDILYDDIETPGPSENVAGPSAKPVKKIKLKAPLDDLSSMVRIKKSKTKDKQEAKPKEPESKEIKTKQVEVQDSSSKRISEEIAPPVYKLNMKKAVKDESKIKSKLMDMLGGYGSGDSESD